MAKLNVDVITPQEKLHEGEADEVYVNTVNGEIGILPGHVSLLTQIQPGELRVKNNGKIHLIAILGGYIEVANNQVNILGDYAVRADDIEIAKAEQAKARAEKAMSEKISQEDMAIAQGELRKAIMELKVARRHRQRVI
jgi:F-type H+-transporting ATPase subunit epsilon